MQDPQQLYMRFGYLKIIFLSTINFEFEELINLESCVFTLNMYLIIGQNPVTKKVSIVSHFKPSDLRLKGVN